MGERGWYIEGGRGRKRDEREEEWGMRGGGRESESRSEEKGMTKKREEVGSELGCKWCPIREVLSNLFHTSACLTFALTCSLLPTHTYILPTHSPFLLHN
jgi:hypothetical protein